MLTFWGSTNRYCDGVTRRDFLRVGAVGTGALGLTLADVLRLRAETPPARDGAVIMVFLPGGPPHLDMYDMKPEAPKEYRGELSPIDTSVAGIQICELFPRQARIMDRFAIVRSLVGSDGSHSAWQFMTGYPQRAERPAIGSVVSRLRGVDASGMPPYVTLNRRNEESPSFLGASHRPFVPSGPGLENLALARGLDAARLEKRRDLLNTFDTLRRDLDASGAMSGLDEFTRRAFDMITSGRVRDAFDLSREDPRIVEAYGKDGKRFLQARRLVEAGVKVVTLGIGGWDTHSNNFKTMRRQLPVLDQALAALVEDLRSRGLADRVAVVMWGEFGRTPKVNKSAGRDHWPQVMSALLAGGGLRTGQVIGSTDSRGERASDRPVRIENLFATLYHVLGIDPATTLTNGAGRPVHLLDEREPIHELI